MKKFTSSKELSKIAKATLAMVLAGSFTFSATKAFADEGTTTTDQNQTVEVQADTSSNANVAEEATEKQETPTLLPGDFFYFAKIALEKITLELTFDDTKEAKLLASNASERLAEAEALFAAGEQKAAIETIKDALEAMKDADKFVEDQQDTTSPTDILKNENESTKEQATTSEKISTEDDQVADEQATEDDKAVKEDETGLKDVKSVLSQNIIALTAAMEKVKNPVAKAALQRNIEKSYAKLAKKVDKWENHLAKKQEKDAQKKHEKEAATTTENSSSDVEPAIETTTPETLPKVTLPATPVEQKAKHEIQSVQKETHVEVKQAKQEAKQKQHEQAKAFVKQKKLEVSKKVELIKEEHKGNNGHKH